MTAFRRRLAFLRWGIPVAISAVVLAYGLGLAPGLAHSPTQGSALIGNLMVLILVGPLGVWLALAWVARWLGSLEKEQALAGQEVASLIDASWSAADAIVGTDANGDIDAWNQGGEGLLGYPAEAVLGSPVSTLFGSGSAAAVEGQWILDMVRRGASVGVHETACLDAEGERVDVELTAAPRRDPAGAVSGVSLVIREVTERKRRDRESRWHHDRLSALVQARTEELAKTLAALGKADARLTRLDETRNEFVSLVTHQIRAPLTNIQGAADQMLINCPAQPPACSRLLVVVQRQIRHLDQLVRNLLNATRVESGELVLHPEPLSILPLLEDAAEQMHPRAGEGKIHLPVKHGLPFVYADPEQVGEVVLNLLDNAVKYSPASEEIDVDVRATPEELTVSVHSGGPGLTPEAVGRAFEKYYRGDASDAQSVYGYGLGLYICRRLIEAQGGTIWAENHPNGGAVFSFTLPTWRESHA